VNSETVTAPVFSIDKILYDEPWGNTTEMYPIFMRYLELRIIEKLEIL
jgi:hypothetical protein